MLYVVDEIIDNIAVLEELETKEKQEISIDLLPIDIHEGNILKYENNEYIKQDDVEHDRRENLRERLEKLKKKI